MRRFLVSEKPVTEPLSPDESLADVTQAHLGPTRRRIIKTGLLMGGAAFANTTLAYSVENSMRQRLPNTPAHLEWVTAYNPDEHREVMLYFPGTGDIRSVAEAQTFRRLSGLQNLPIGALVMSHFHSTEDELIEKTAEALSQNPPDNLSYVGKSWGGAEGLKVTAKVAAMLGCKLKNFSMWSTPYDISDGYQGSLGSTLDDWFPDWNVFNFDAKVMAVIGRRIKADGYVHTFSHLDEARAEVESGEDWNGLRSDVHMLDEVDSHRTITELVSKVSEPGVTSGSYIMSYRPWTDPTVNVVAASGKYSKDFEDNGIPFKVIRGDFEGHAEIEPCTEATTRWMRADA